MMTFAISFTNFGPYHLARLRALAHALGREGGRLIAYETANVERKYAWRTDRGNEPFEWVTLCPGSDLETLPKSTCTRAMLEALERDQPDALGLVGYVRPECLAAVRWAERHERPAILMSESQAIDRPRVWWKETIKRRRVRRFAAGLCGGPRHRAYLVDLGMPADRIALGYNAVDNEYFARRAAVERRAGIGRRELPPRPYFLAVSRFVPEKNLPRLVRAFARYRRAADASSAWDLVLCGDGPDASRVDQTIRTSGCAWAIHRPGFMQADALARRYAFAGAFVLPSLSEPWGLVANEAAACDLPLLISDRCGCSETLVPDPPGVTGWRFDPENEAEITERLSHLASLPETDRAALGRRASALAADWGPERFARGTLEAIELARPGAATRQIMDRPSILTQVPIN